MWRVNSEPQAENCAGRIYFARAFSNPGPHGGLTPWETKFVLYRPSHKKDKKDRIVLVKDKRA